MPDRRDHFGTVGFYIEVKADGKKPTPMQQAELARANGLGYFAFALAGDQGLSDFYATLAEQLSEEHLTAHVEQWLADARQLRNTLEELI